MSSTDGRPWEAAGDLPWDTPDELERADSEDWRGNLHLADWPMHLAGPEYSLNKGTDLHRWWRMRPRERPGL